MAVALRRAWRLRRQAPLRSTATKAGRGSRWGDLTTGVGLQNEELLTKNKSQRVTPLLAQRIALTGNGYFWRTAQVQIPPLLLAATTILSPSADDATEIQACADIAFEIQVSPEFVEV